MKSPSNLLHEDEIFQDDVYDQIQDDVAITWRRESEYE